MHQNNSVNNSCFLHAIPAVSVFVFIYLFIYFIQGIPMIDDAFIFYRYAENWANGYGLVFNVGEYVEGYSSLLWTVVLAIGAFFSISPTSLAPIMNLIVGVLCILLMNYLIGYVSFSRPRLAGIILPLIYAGSYAVYLYGIAGMDTLIFSLVFLFTLATIYKSTKSKNYYIVIPFLILMNVARAEGPLYSAFLLLMLTYIDYGETKSISKKLMTVIAVYTVSSILLFFARYIVYGEILPATMLAKGYTGYTLKKIILEGDFTMFREFLRVIYSGIKYEASFFYLGIWIPFIILYFNRDKKEHLLWFIASAIAVNAFISIVAGGDWMPFHRHFVPFIPVVIIFIAWAFDFTIKNYRETKMEYKAALILILTIVSSLWIASVVHPLEFVKKHGVTQNVRSLSELGNSLRDISFPTTLLTDRAGILPYHAGIDIYVRDIFGLTDIHNAKNGDFFCFPPEGGVCGRTDYFYSFSAPFNIFSYSTRNITPKFIKFCKDNSSLCKKYRFYYNHDWLKQRFFVVADITHPVSEMLVKKYNVIPAPINEKFEELFNIVYSKRKYKSE